MSSHPSANRTIGRRGPCVHPCTHTLAKMVRICKITAEKNILKLKDVVKVTVIVGSGSPKVVCSKTVFSESS